MAAGVLSMLSATAAWADEPGGDTPPAAPSAPASPPAAPQRPKVAIGAGMLGRLVVVTTRDRSVEGKLITLDDDVLVLQTYSRQNVTIERAAVLSARPRHTDAAPRASADPEVDNVLGAASDSAPSPWGVWCGISAGPAWGDSTGPAAPLAMVMVDFAASYHFVYLGAGLGGAVFEGASTFSNETTLGRRSSGAPGSFSGYVEAGLTKGLFIPYNAREAIELRPGVGYGILGMTNATQSIDHCIDCDQRTFAYNGGHYVRFQLGVYYSTHPEGSVVHRVFMRRNGFFIGGTVSLQELVFGDEPRPDRVLSFALTTGWGP